MQKIIKTISKSILHHLLPQLTFLNTRRRFMSNAIVHRSPPNVSHDLTRTLATEALKYIEWILIHFLYIASCILNPGLRSFSFFISSVDIHAGKMKGKWMIHWMIDTYSTTITPWQPSWTLNEAPITTLTNGVSLKNAMRFLDKSRPMSSDLIWRKLFLGKC